MWGERVPAGRRGGVLLACAATGAIGAGRRPALDQHSPWIDYEALTRGLTPTHVDSVRLDPALRAADWPRTGTRCSRCRRLRTLHRRVLEDREPRRLRRNRVGRRQRSAPAARLERVSAPTITRYTQTLTVTIRAMNTNQVIAAGYATLPAGPPAKPGAPGRERGHVDEPDPLGPGDTYTVSVLLPAPERRAARARPARTIPADSSSRDLALTMPQNPPQRVAAADGPVPDVRHATRRPQDQTEPDEPADAARRRSASSPVRARLRARAARSPREPQTPYAFVESVLRYLSPQRLQLRPVPAPDGTIRWRPSCSTTSSATASSSRARWRCCCGWAGVPARVAAGFTTGTSTAHQEWS